MKKLGKYELLGELGRGAFGIVYRARDPVIDRMVALKTITAAVADDPQLLARFYREARSAGFLQHPNIVTIYDMGDENGTPFIAMELVDGHNLDDLIGRRAPVTLAVKLLYGVQAARALDYAHKRGIIHRDIKPGNVMLSKDGVIKVVDFGIARALESSKTQTGSLIGTVSYMAPEAFHGEHGSERTDIWSFGVLLYELIAYKAPFTGQSPAALMQSICLKEPLELRQLVPECPEDLSSLIQRMLRKPQEERVQSMEEVLLDLEPMCRRLHAEAVPELLAQAERLIEEEEFVKARETLRQLLQGDAGNAEARGLSEKVNLGLKRIAVRPRVQEHLERARGLLKNGDLHHADAELRQAWQLDSQFQPLRELQAELQRELNRVQQAGEHLQSARQRLIEGLPDEAEALLAKARELDPSNQQLSGIDQQVREAKEGYQTRARLASALQQARTLWSSGNYRESIDLLAQLEQQFPGEEQITRLLETAREDEAEQSKQERLCEARALLAAGKERQSLELLGALQQTFPGDREIARLLAAAQQDQADKERKQKLADARALFSRQQFSDAVTVLDSLLAYDPADSAVLKLRTLAQHEQEKQAQSESLRREWEGLKHLVSGKDYPEAIRRGEALLQEFPGERDLSRLVEFARQQQDEIEKAAHLRSLRAQVQSLLEARKFAEASSLCRTALDAFPADAELIALRERAETDTKKQVVQRAIELRVRDIKGKINRGELTDAKELARDTLSTLGPDTDVQQLLSSAEVEYEARERRSHQDEQLAEVKALMAAGKLDEAVSTLEILNQNGRFDGLDPRLQQMAEEIAIARNQPGPVSPPAFPSAESAAKEYAVLDGPAPASDLLEDGQQAMPEISEEPARSVAHDLESQFHSTVPSPAAPPAGLTPEIIEQAAHQLARYVGPISRVLAKKASQRTENPRVFYLLLSEYVEGESERADFLAGAGFAD